MTLEVAPVARRKRPKRAKEQIVEIPVSLIDTGLNNRTVFDEDELAELARDIAERGLLQVPCVRPVVGSDRFQLVYGERRFRACLLLGWMLLPVVIRTLDDTQAFTAMLVENNQRKDPDPIDQAQGFQRAIDEHGWSVQQIYEHTRVKTQVINARLALLRLHEEYQKMLRKGQLELNLAELMVNLDHNRQAVAVRVLTSVSRRPTSAEFRRVVGDLFKEQVAEQQQGMLFPDLEQLWREKLEAAAATGKRARKQRLPLNPAIPPPPRFKRNWWFANQMHDYAEQLRAAGFTEGGDAIDHVVEMAIECGILEADESQF
jgi:ParB family transcriptional regulator, chromosome partitioning protein